MRLLISEVDSRSGAMADVMRLNQLGELPASDAHRWTPATCAWKLDELLGKGAGNAFGGD
ncbi:hypothetical protein [uncultured Mobiluncus sp.]|uniref:hypothetical protein n=1 Tax=uncultured Mobiluncus sp. TaxID=293425 RepID=UPI0025E6EAB1|nr:hypothetical protein [uncultured Mobiluncus sp.]